MVASRNYRNKCRWLRNPANPTTITTSLRTPNVDLTWMDPIAARKLSNHCTSRITLRHTRQLEINASEKGNERRIVQQKTKMLREYYVAARMGDSGEMSDVMERIIKFNSKHPGVAITGDTISRSMKQHARTSAEMYHGVTFNKRLRPEIMQSIQEYE